MDQIEKNCNINIVIRVKLFALPIGISVGAFLARRVVTVCCGKISIRSPFIWIALEQQQQQEERRIFLSIASCQLQCIIYIVIIIYIVYSFTPSFETISS